MTLFDGEPMEIVQPRKKTDYSIIISASRMTDMPKYYPNELISAVLDKVNSGIKIHTLVLWTKHPASLLNEPMCSFLKEIKTEGIQLFLQCTITGMGGLVVGKCKNSVPLILEPNAPIVDDAIAVLPDIINLLENSKRIRLRIDPIVRIIDASGKRYSNLQIVSKIIQGAKKYGINDFSFSFLESGLHRKVDKRFRELGIQISSPNQEERDKSISWFRSLETKYCVTIKACCVPGFPETKCIDGELLKNLHDKNLEADLRMPRKRDLCGCTQSVDIGGWPPKKCLTGCQYCYANASYI